MSDVYEIMEKVIIEGDLSKLTPKERVEYYDRICKSLKLNPMTRPFEYVRFDGKLTLYPKKDCTEQLRNTRRISIIKLEKEVIDGIFICTAYAKAADGQEDISTGAVSIKGLTGKPLSNAIKIAETQAKRRVTLSICGLGMTDESELADVPNAQPVAINHETGEIVHCPMPALEEPKPDLFDSFELDQEALFASESLASLKDKYVIMAKQYADQPDKLAEIVKIKDVRKAELEGTDK